MQRSEPQGQYRRLTHTRRSNSSYRKNWRNRRSDPSQSAGTGRKRQGKNNHTEHQRADPPKRCIDAPRDRERSQEDKVGSRLTRPRHSSAPSAEKTFQTLLG